MAKTEKRLFSRETEVTIEIDAPAERVWTLLTDAAGYPGWTGTVLSIDGRIALGERIALKSSLDPKRTFKLKVKEFVPSTRLVWGDAMGTRTYEITPRGSGVSFSMRERIGGPLFPLFAGMIPSFDEAFDTFARDLKKKAESLTGTPAAFSG